MERLLVWCALLSLVGATAVWGGDYVTWTDEQGVVHFGDSDADIPPQYRQQVSERDYSKKAPQSTVKEKIGETSLPPETTSSDEEGGWKPRIYTVKFRRWQQTARRIIIDVRFNGSVTAPMVLDTGAPGTIISYELAEKLGLSAERSGALMSRAGGIGGSTPAVETILDTVQVDDMVDTFVPTTVTDFRANGLYEGLLGMSFMSNFSLKIDHAHGLLTFEELPPDRMRPGGHDREWWLSTFYNFAYNRKQWRSYLEQVEKMKRSGSVSGAKLERIEELIPFLKYQERQASKMFDKLDRYASHKAVPTEWRRY